MQISQSKRVSLSSQEEKQEEKEGRPVLKGLNRSQLLIIALMAVANCFATITFSCIVPFFPTEAVNRKGLSTAQVGLVIGLFQLVIFFLSPLIGQNMATLRPSRAFPGGILLSGLASIAFGLAYFLPPGMPFFFGLTFIRAIQATGSAAFSTGSWAIVGRLFQDRINLITGINEVAYGIGFTVGPPLGSILYELGGFLLPLIVVGLAQALVALLSLPLLWTHLAEDATSDQGKGGKEEEEGEQCKRPAILQLLFIPDVFMAMLSLFAVCFAWSYYEPSLAQHLSSFPGWSNSALVGAMMSVLSVSYLIMSPIWGFFMDRCLAGRTTSLMLLGGILVLAACLLMGPAPFFGLEKSLFCMGTSFVLLGISGAILYIPVFKWCVDAAKSAGFDEKSPALCGLISGFFQSTVSLGSFLGTALGGWSVQRIGFEWTSVWVAGLELVQLCLQLIYGLAKRINKRRMQKRIVPII